MTIHRKKLNVRAKAPDASGTFEGVIEFNPEKGDSDNERIDSWVNLPTTVPLGYQHAYGDPEAQIGTAKALQLDPRRLKVLGALDLAGRNVMAKAVHERMLLPSDDPRVLSELSVGFHYDTETTTDDQGVTVIHDAFLDEISVVYRGAQGSAVSNVKQTWPASTGATTVTAGSTVTMTPAPAPPPTLAETVVRTAWANGVRDKRRLAALHYVAKELAGNPATLKETLAGMVDDWRDPDTIRLEKELDMLEGKKFANRGALSAGPVPVELNILDKAQMRRHLQTGHDYDERQVGATSRNRLSRLHQNLHGMGHVGHSHSAADALLQQLRQEQLDARNAKAAQDEWLDGMNDRVRLMTEGSIDDREAEAIALEDEQREQRAADQEREAREREQAEEERDRYLRNRPPGYEGQWVYSP